MTPEEALQRARAAAAAAGHDEDALPRLPGAGGTGSRVRTEQLLEWSVIEPDPELLRSTRRFGAPITAVKRLARRLLQQELNELAAQQTRFNVHVLQRLIELEARDRPPGPERRGPA